MKRGKRFKIYRLALLAFLILSVSAFSGISIYGMKNQIPSTIYVRAMQSQTMDLGIPATGTVKASPSGRDPEGSAKAVTVNLSGPVTMLAGERDQYDLEVRLFGIIPLKRVELKVIDEKELIPMGTPVGIYLQSKGVMVVGIVEFEGADGQTKSPAEAVLKTGDLILKANGRKVEKKEELILEIEKCQGSKVSLVIERDGAEKNIAILPALNQAGQYKAGIWVKDDVQGVGTLTYVDGNGSFGALGHGIADSDTGRIVEINDGALYQTEIVKLRKGENGHPGEMTGKIIYEEKYVLGEITENSDRGVYGSFNARGLSTVTNQPVPIAFKQEIEIGPAEIFCTIDEEVEHFQIEVTKVRLEQDDVNRGIEFRVTDQNLLLRTGGIVQGMSGSPILQNGKIIGAVTHVLVNSPEKGYGIFIENMMAEEDSN